jgi:hypothetical protein
MAEYVDGMRDCEIPSCPLYFAMPYRQQEPDYWWVGYSPRGKGKRPLHKLNTFSQKHPRNAVQEHEIVTEGSR